MRAANHSCADAGHQSFDTGHLQCNHEAGRDRHHSTCCHEDGFVQLSALFRSIRAHNRGSLSCSCRQHAAPSSSVPAILDHRERQLHLISNFASFGLSNIDEKSVNDRLEKRFIDTCRTQISRLPRTPRLVDTRFETLGKTPRGRCHSARPDRYCRGADAAASPVTRNGQKLVSVSVDLCQNQFP